MENWLSMKGFSVHAPCADPGASAAVLQHAGGQDQHLCASWSPSCTSTAMPTRRALLHEKCIPIMLFIISSFYLSFCVFLGMLGSRGKIACSVIPSNDLGGTEACLGCGGAIAGQITNSAGRNNLLRGNAWAQIEGLRRFMPQLLHIRQPGEPAAAPGAPQCGLRC